MKPTPRDEAEPEKSKAVTNSRSKKCNDALSSIAVSPVMNSARTVELFSRATIGGELDLRCTVDAVASRVAKMSEPRSSEVQATLAAQATALDSMFTDLAMRAGVNLEQHPGAAEIYLRLALKAQSQCRMTLHTLSDIQAPRPFAFVQQANISHGAQQVNNGRAAPREGAGDENINRANELLGGDDVERLDSGTAKAPIDAHSFMAALGERDRAKD